MLRDEREEGQTVLQFPLSQLHVLKFNLTVTSCSTPT